MDLTSASAREWDWIGVDGGASGWRAVGLRPAAVGARVELDGRSAELSTATPAEFVPHPLERQLATSVAAPDAPGEADARERWISAAAEAVLRVARQGRGRPLLVGVCAPGLKTPDGRGVLAARNGPRAPALAAELERRLRGAGFALARPIARLVSDGLACGVGEDVAREGAFAAVDDAWYLGGGSGLAEAAKLAGRVHAVEELEPAIPRAWRMPLEEGGTFEDALSLRGLNRAAAAAGIPGRFEFAALEGDPRALRLFARGAERLAELAALRAAAVGERCGRRLARVVVGQRLGRLFLDPRFEPLFAEPARAALRRRLGPGAALELVGSDLRAAPAIGALALALGEA